MGKIEKFRNAVVSPYEFIDGKFRGGLGAEFRSSNSRMPVGQSFRDEPTGNTFPLHSLAGRHLFAGPIWNHFGHILVDSLHRMWAYNGHDSVVFSGVIGLRGVRDTADLKKWSVPGFVPRLLDYMEVSSDIHVVSEPTCFDQLDVPEPGAIWRMNIMPFYRHHLRRFQANIGKRTAGIRPTAKRLYYPRTHMLTDGGIIGSSYFEKILAHNGFTICYPETLSLDQQFANIMNADQIVFDEGSSIHLTELLEYVPARLYMIPRRDEDVVFGRALNPRGGLVYLSPEDNIGLLPDRNGALVSPAALSFVKDPGKVVRRMQEYGLVTLRFDSDDFCRHELQDLMSAKSKDADARDERAAILKEYRSCSITSQI